MIQPENNQVNATSSPSLLSGDELVQQLCESLELRILAGENVRSEAFLSEFPAIANDPEQAMDLIYTEFVARTEMGELPCADEFFVRFPHWRNQLQRQFQLAEALDNSPMYIRANESLNENSQGLSNVGMDRRFRIGKLLARGGIGQVMHATDMELHREVAVKEILPHLAQNLDVRERFLREAEITGRLEHPGVVPVYGLGRDNQHRPFYAMRLVRGESFQEAINAFHEKYADRRRFHSIEFQKLLRRFLSVCETISYAHSRGVIHRDLKPHNVMLGPFGETLVVDWGLAKVIQLPPIHVETNTENPAVKNVNEASEIPLDPTDPTTSSANWSVDLTQTAGALIGSPAFMSPEQACGESHVVGPASDIYSLGATLHCLLTGKSRFGDSDVDETLRQLRAGNFARPRDLNRHVPRALEAICLKALSQEPPDRYSSPSALASDIEHWLADEPVSIYREPVVKRAGRWVRRNRTPAILGLIALILVSAISTLAAFRINGERLRADRERIEARRVSARLAFDRGYQLTEQHEYGQGLMWFVRALQNTPADDRDLRRVILTNMSAGRDQLLHWRGAFVHEPKIAVHAFDRQGKQLLTANQLGEVKFWDVDTGALIREQKIASQGVIGASFTDDGAAYVATVQSRALSIHKLRGDADDGEAWRETVEHDDADTKVNFSPDGKTVCVTGRMNGPTTVRVFRAADGELLRKIINPSTVREFHFQPKSNFLAVAGSDARIRVWDWANVSSDFSLIELERPAHCFDYTPDGKRLVLASGDGSVLCWDVASKRTLFELGKYPGTVTAVACSRDGKTMAAAWDTGIARAWSLVDGRPACELLRLDRYTMNLDFRPNARQMLVMAERSSAILWDLPDPTKTSVPLSQTHIAAVQFSANGALAITGDLFGIARLRDGKTARVYGNTMAHTKALKRVAVRPDGDVVLTASDDGTVRLWDAHTGEPHGKILEHKPTPESRILLMSAEFSPDGGVIATGDSTGVVRIWKGETGELIRTLARVRGTAVTLCFRPDGRRLLVGYAGPENGVRMWDTATGELQWKAQHDEAVRCVDISPDGKVALSASNDETARLWDAESGLAIGPELQHRGEVFVARFSPDSSLAATGGYDATVRLWQASTGLAYGTPMMHDSLVTDVAFSSDGRRLLSGSIDKTARLWDVATCLPLAPPLQHDDRLRSLKFNPVENSAISGRFWRLPHPLPDDLALVERWARLATERTFTTGNNIQWLNPTTYAAESTKFEALTGKKWTEWGE